MLDRRAMALALSLALFAAGCGGARASTAEAPASPLTGTWKIDLSKSTIPPAMKPKEMTITLTVEGNSVRVREESVEANGRPLTVTAEGYFDGKDYPVSGHPTVDSASFTLLDSRSMETLAKKAGRLIFKETIIVAEDGKSLTDTLSAGDGTEIGVGFFGR